MKRIWLYRLAITRASLYCTWICVGAFRLATETHRPFPELPPWEKFMVLMNVFEMAVPALLAFLDKTSAKLSGELREEAENDYTAIKSAARTAALLLLVLAVIILKSK